MLDTMTKQFQHFIRSLENELKSPLPGKDAQYRMAPQPRSKPWKGSYDAPQEDARQSGVLVLFYPDDDQICLPLILRQTYAGVHSGQIGLPGGGYEHADADLAATALRETHEEIGVPSNNVQIIGELSSLYVFASNFVVQPVVGWVSVKPNFQIDTHEVAQLIETPLNALCNPANQRTEVWELRDRRATVPHFRIQEHNVWGATAMILSELLALESVRHDVS